MKTRFFAISLLIILCLTSCNHRTIKTRRHEAPSAVETLIKDSVFIDFDYNSLTNGLNEGEEVPESQKAETKAALYRFLQHVKVVDGYFSCDLKNGSEINISEELFNNMMSNLENGNSQLKEARDKGIEVSVPEVPKEYLESLLQ